MADTGELIHVDPGTLVVGANVRVDTRVDNDLVESIRQRGVLEPIVAYADGDQLVVVHGQRRTLAAVKAGVADVPVWVRNAPADADRLVDQVVENDHRAQLAEAERIAAYEQLSAIGVSAAQIARRTATPRQVVNAALKTAGSTTARAAVAEHGLTIEQAAAIAEFEHRPVAVERLIESAQDGGRGWEHRLQYFRDQEPELALRDAKVAELQAQGVKVVDRVVGKIRFLDSLSLSVDEHAGCPGHAAVVETDTVWADNAPEDDPGQLVALVEYVCTDAAEHGHIPGPDAKFAGDDARAANDAKLREKEAEKRRETIANNKAWRAAQTVRQAWLKTFAARKTSPKGAAAFLATELAWFPFGWRKPAESGSKLAHELLGLAAAGYGKYGTSVAAHLDGASDARAAHVALVLVLSWFEEATDQDSWRFKTDPTRRYLRWLQAQGYELSDVERLAAGLDVS